MFQKANYLEQGPEVPLHKAIRVIAPRPRIYYDNSLS